MTNYLQAFCSFITLSGRATPSLSALAFTFCLLQFSSCKKNEPVVREQLPGDINTICGTAGKLGYTGDNDLAKNAQIGFITGLATDASEDVYMSDGAANVIRKITLSTGLITTVGGKFISLTGVDPSPNYGEGIPALAAHLGSPNGIAISPGTGNIYFADGTNHVIRKIDINTGTITTPVAYPLKGAGFSGDYGPALEATLNNPYDVAVDQFENIYIADAQNNAVRKVNASTGTITTIAGLGPDYAGYTGDEGSATVAQLNFPEGLALDAAGDVYIADTHNNVIRKVTTSTGIITTIAGGGPANAGYSGDGGLATAAHLWGPNRLTFDVSGNLLISEGVNNIIRKIDMRSGIITTVAGNGKSGFSGDAGPATSATLFAPQGIAVDATGNIYVADSHNSVIRVINSK